MRDQAPRGTANILAVALAIFSIPYGSACAATLVLNDGTTIHGEVKSLQDDVYTVETDSLGTLHVRKQNVRSIDHAGEGANKAPRNEPVPSEADIETMQLRMMQNTSLLPMLLALQNDPEVQAILADPDIMDTLMSGDYATLMNHPKIIALTRNANVREVIDAVH